MRIIAAYALGFLSVLCALLSLFSLVKHTERLEVTSKGINLSVLFLTGSMLFGWGSAITAGADVQSSICVLGLIFAAIAVFWVSTLVKRRYLRKGIVEVLEEVAQLIQSWR